MCRVRVGIDITMAEAHRSFGIVNIMPPAKKRLEFRFVNCSLWRLFLLSRIQDDDKNASEGREVTKSYRSRGRVTKKVERGLA